MRQPLRCAALAIAAALMVSCQPSTAVVVAATANPLIPAPVIQTDTATAGAAQTPQPLPTVLVPSPTIAVTIPLPSTGAAVPDSAVTRLGIGQIKNAVFSPDSRYLAVGTSVGVYLYEARSLSLKWSRPSEGPVLGLRWMPYGNVIAAWNGTQDTVFGYEAGSGDTLFELDLTGPIGGVAWSPDGTKLAIAWGGRNSYQAPQPEELIKRISVWDTKTFERLYTSVLPYNTKLCSGACANLLDSLVWSADGRWLAAISSTIDKSAGEPVFSSYIFVWDAESGKLVQAIQQSNVSSVSFSPDSRLLVAWTKLLYGFPFDYANVIMVWDPVTGQARPVFGNPKGPDETGIPDIDWRPDGSELIIARQDWQIVRWDVAADKAIQQITYPMDMLDIEWSPNAQYFGVVGSYIDFSEPHQAAIWRTGDTEPLYTINRDFNISLDYNLNPKGGLKISPDSSLVAIFGSSQLSMFDLADGTEIAPAVVNSKFYEVDWSPDSKEILEKSPIGSDNGTCLARVVVWDIRGTATASIRLENECLSLDGKYNDKKVTSPDGRWLATATITQLGEKLSKTFQSELVITDQNNAQVLLDAHGPPAEALRIAWSPDSSMVAVGGGLHEDHLLPDIRGWFESAVMVWNVATGEQKTFLGHTGRVEELKFSPDGTLLASKSVDGTVLIWQVK